MSYSLVRSDNREKLVTPSAVIGLWDLPALSFIIFQSLDTAKLHIQCDQCRQIRKRVVVDYGQPVVVQVPVSTGVMNSSRAITRSLAYSR